MEELDVRDRIRKVLHDHNDASIYSIAKNDNERTNMQRQINGNVTVSLQTIKRVVEAFPETSTHWLVTGEGLQERTRIVTPPTQQHHHQDIHLAEGATAAISQSGTASLDTTTSPMEKDATKERELFTPADIAQWVSEQNVGALVGVILAQKDEIIRIKEQRIADLEKSLSIADAQLFPPVK